MKDAGVGVARELSVEVDDSTTTTVELTWWNSRRPRRELVYDPLAVGVGLVADVPYWIVGVFVKVALVVLFVHSSWLLTQ